MAKRLTGQWPNLKPDNQATFGTAVAAVLAQYPVAMVEQCCDPVRGLAKRCEFFSLKRLTDWLDEETRYYAKRLELADPERDRHTYVIPIGGTAADAITVADYKSGARRLAPIGKTFVPALRPPEEPAA